MDISKFRKDFPLLNSDDNPTYLDSACMTLRPQVVIDALTDYYTNYPACGGRSVHKLSWQVTENFEIARDQIRRFMGAEKPTEIVFTKNATEGMNIVANGLNLKRFNFFSKTSRCFKSNLPSTRLSVWGLFGPFMV